jgi:hypothetical protein
MSSKIIDIDPRDRRVILVASKSGLAKIAAKAYDVEYLDKMAEGMSSSLLFKLAKYGKDVFIKSKEEEFSKKSVSELKICVDKALNLGLSPILVDPSDAIKNLKFGVGNTPADGSIYVQHPIFTDAYISPPDFSRSVSKEKEAAFRQLASALGAKNLTLVNASVKTTRGFFGASVSVPDAASEVGIKVSIDKSGTFVKKVYCEYGTPRRHAWVPPDLLPWVDMDPDLRTMARDRVEGHLLRNSIILEFKEGIGVGGEIASKLAGRGFGVAGEYQSICHTVWHFDVEYHPISTQ